MALALNNIKTLANSLRENNWYITAFSTTIWAKEYAVVFEDLRAVDKGSKYYAVELTFIDIRDDFRKLSVRANSYGFRDSDKDAAINFFGIRPNGNNKYSPMYIIYTPLNNSCPTIFNKHPNSLKNYIIDKVSERDGLDGNGTCCYKAMRNPRPKTRTEFNTAKTRLFRPNLFDLLGKNDTSISFCYRDADELSDAIIIANFNK